MNSGGLDIKKENRDWEVRTNRYVLFFDILGFKDLVNRNSHDIIYEKLSSFHDRIEFLGITGKTEPRTKDYLEQYFDTNKHLIIFSDSIVFFTEKDSEQDFQAMILASYWIFNTAIELGIAMKASLAYGDISVNREKQIFFGQPIIDAFQLQEELDYMGIICHHSADKKIEEFFTIGSSKLFKEIKTPLKKGSVNHINLLWFNQKEKQGNVEEIINRIRQIKYQVSGNPRRYVDNTLAVINEYHEYLEFGINAYE